MIMFGSLFATASVQIFKAADTVSKKREIESLRNYIRLSISCEETLEALESGCADGERIALFRGNSSSIILKNEDTRMGKFLLQAKCTDTPGEYSVTYKLGSSPWANLFKKIPLTCS